MWNGPFTLYLTVANLFKRIAGMLLQHLIYTFKSVVQNRLAENLIVLECQRVEPSQRCIYAWTHNSLSETNNTLVSCTLDKRSMTELSVDKPSGAEFTKRSSYGKIVRNNKFQPILFFDLLLAKAAGQCRRLTNEKFRENCPKWTGPSSAAHLKMRRLQAHPRITTLAPNHIIFVQRMPLAKCARKLATDG